MTTSATLGDFTISRQPDPLDDVEVLDSQAAGPTKQRAIRLGPRMASVCLSVYMRAQITRKFCIMVLCLSAFLQRYWWPFDICLPLLRTTLLRVCGGTVSAFSL